MSDPKRRDRVARVAEARDRAGKTPVRLGSATYWVTRDRFPCGALGDYVRVWLRRPSRVRYCDGHVYWWAGRDDDGVTVLALYAEWSLADCAKTLGTIPDDERQCLRRDGTGLHGAASA